MSESQYDVVLKGVISGFDAEQAKSDFAALFSLDFEKVSRLFSAQRTVLKAGVDEQTANKYTARLAGIGVAAEAEAVAKVEGVAPAAGAQESVQAVEAGSGHAETTQAPLGLVPVEEANASASNYDSAGAGGIDAGSAVAEEKPSIVRHEFQFTGSGFEYFKIWIVNLLLNIVTIGIYSAWAKVRNKQYFYGNTQIAGSSFEYTAQPLKILLGRVIAIALYGSLFYAQHFAPMIGVILSLVFLIFIPWIVVSSLRFKARNTSYRNLSFRFNGTVLGAFVNFLVWPILGILTFFLLMPLAWKKQTQYIINNHSYGTEPFHFDVSVNAYFKMLGIMLGASLVFFAALAMVFGPSIKEMILSQGADPTVFLKLIPMIAIYLFFSFGLGAYVVATMANIQFNNTGLQEHKFASDWTTPSYLALTLINTIGIVLTLGLFIPFAKVRAAAYKAEHTSLLVVGDLDNFVARELEQSNSVGEGVHDIFDIDISI
jgi:uncharacterized membrane protein YjgN (DUF898 family)